jgi:ribosomal protein L22
MTEKKPQNDDQVERAASVSGDERSEAGEAARAAAAAEAAAEAQAPEAEAAAAEATEAAEKAAEAAEAAAEAPKPKRARKARQAEIAADEAEDAAEEAGASGGERSETGEAAAKKPRAKKAAATEAVSDEAVSDEADEEAKPAAKKPRAKKADEKPKIAPARKRDRRRPVEPGVKVSAHAKYVRTSARKARLVCDHIRGKDVADARAILAFTPRAAAKDWAKLLESAVANAEHNHELVGEELRIAAVYADEGPTLKRYRPRAMGRATRIRKRTSHLTITLTPKEL